MLGEALPACTAASARRPWLPPGQGPAVLAVRRLLRAGHATPALTQIRQKRVCEALPVLCTHQQLLLAASSLPQSVAAALRRPTASLLSLPSEVSVRQNALPRPRPQCGAAWAGAGPHLPCAAGPFVTCLEGCRGPQLGSHSSSRLGAGARPWAPVLESSPGCPHSVSGILCGTKSTKCRVGNQNPALAVLCSACICRAIALEKIPYKFPGVKINQLEAGSMGAVCTTRHHLWF